MALQFHLCSWYQAASLLSHRVIFSSSPPSLNHPLSPNSSTSLGCRSFPTSSLTWPACLALLVGRSHSAALASWEKEIRHVLERQVTTNTSHMGAEAAQSLQLCTQIWSWAGCLWLWAHAADQVCGHSSVEVLVDTPAEGISAAPWQLCSQGRGRKAVAKDKPGHFFRGCNIKSATGLREIWQASDPLSQKGEWWQRFSTKRLCIICQL